jgi:hypothetical protein
MLEHEQAIQGNKDWEPRFFLKDGASMPLVGFGTQYGWSEDGCGWASGLLIPLDATAPATC